jgi:hypothetical protein
MILAQDAGQIVSGGFRYGRQFTANRQPGFMRKQMNRLTRRITGKSFIHSKNLPVNSVWTAASAPDSRETSLIALFRYRPERRRRCTRTAPTPIAAKPALCFPAKTGTIHDRSCLTNNEQ